MWILTEIKMHVTHFEFLKSASINTNTFCGHKETWLMHPKIMVVKWQICFTKLNEFTFFSPLPPYSLMYTRGE